MIFSVFVANRDYKGRGCRYKNAVICFICVFFMNVIVAESPDQVYFGCYHSVTFEVAEDNGLAGGPNTLIGYLVILNRIRDTRRGRLTGVQIK